MEGSMNLTPDCSTPSSTSPIDVLGLLNDDDDFEGSAGERSRRPSDEDFHLPLFKRGERSDIFTRPTQEVKGPCFHLSSNVSAFPGSDLKLSDDFSNENDYNRRFMSNKSMASFCDNLMKNNHSQIDDMLLTQPSLSLPAIGEERGVPKSPDGDQELLSQAVSIIQAMNLIGKNPSSDITLGSQQALANIAALAQIGESEKGQIRGPNLSRQVSFPPEAYQPPPVAMYNKPPQMNGYQQQSRTLGDIWKNGSSYARNFIAPATNNGVSFSNAPYNNVTNGFGMVGMGGRTPLRPSFSLPNGYPEPPKVTGDYGDLMQIRCKFGQLGGMQGQFNAPHGFCIGRFEEIVVADTHNHRVQVFDKNGTFQFMFGRAGKDEGCLWHPRKVAVLRHNGHFVVCDRGNERSRMQLFNERGMFVHRISIRFVDIVAGLATTSSGQIVVVDSVRPTIFILDPVSGGLVTYFECAEFMSEPSDIAVYNDDFYVCDFKGHSVVVVNSSGQFLRKIALEGVSLFPNGIDISDEGDILVGDSHGNQFHVAIYNRFGEFVSHFHCPHVKVSRCCGLKITSEGYIITLAKNNHHVLVLNTLFVA